jgi:ABC-type antimicrobial peptide transport system permease subunit
MTTAAPQVDVAVSDVGEIPVRPALVWQMALSSLRVRLFRAFLTVLTISTAAAFMMYLLVMPVPEGAETAQSVTERQSWYLMLVLALVVSGAGVLNTMLMSVTQRYREIGTMKCLGAPDMFVLASTLVEAAILGLIGAAIGVLAGIFIGFLLGLAEFGLSVFSHVRLDLWLLPKTMIVFLVGMFLTTLGACVPAYIAARMPPIEAMRGEK